jgi:hypothetical protein
VNVLLSGRTHVAICWAVEKHVSNQASQWTCQEVPLAAAAKDATVAPLRS